MQGKQETTSALCDFRSLDCGCDSDTDSNCAMPMARETSKTQTLRTKPRFSPCWSGPPVFRLPKPGQFHVAIRVTPKRCDSCAHGALPRRWYCGETFATRKFEIAPVCSITPKLKLVEHSQKGWWRDASQRSNGQKQAKAVVNWKCWKLELCSCRPGASEVKRWVHRPQHATKREENCKQSTQIAGSGSHRTGPARCAQLWNQSHTVVAHCFFGEASVD